MTFTNTADWKIESILVSGRGRTSVFKRCITSGDKILMQPIWPMPGAPVQEIHEGECNIALCVNAPTLLKELEKLVVYCAGMNYDLSAAREVIRKAKGH